MINELDRVVLTTSVPGEGLEVGDVGTVVHVHRDGLAFATLTGDTTAVVTLEAAQVRPVGKREIAHARELARQLTGDWLTDRPKPETT